MEACKHCSCRNMQLTEYGSFVCLACGVEDFSTILCNTQSSAGAYSVPLHAPATYTRVKRFRKYLLRASMTQSASTIPKATWDYLLGSAPYRGPGNIVRKLKKAPRHVRKKCYDSLPLLVQMLCPNIDVPRLTELDKMQSLVAFKRLDAEYCAGEPFVSYLFALEYILRLIGRSDVLPYINKICCRKRRSEYTHRLDRIFKSNRRRLA